MNERSIYLYIFPLVALLAGGIIPLLLLESYQSQTEWGNKTQSVMYISMIVIISWIFNKVGSRNNKLKIWATDTVIGTSLMIFAYSFMVMFSVNIFLLIPLPSFVLFIISLLISAFGCIIFFSMGNEKNS